MLFLIVVLLAVLAGGFLGTVLHVAYWAVLALAALGGVLAVAAYSGVRRLMDGRG